MRDDLAQVGSGFFAYSQVIVHLASYEQTQGQQELCLSPFEWGNNPFKEPKDLDMDNAIVHPAANIFTIGRTSESVHPEIETRYPGNIFVIISLSIRFFSSARSRTFVTYLVFVREFYGPETYLSTCSGECEAQNA